MESMPKRLLELAKTHTIKEIAILTNTPYSTVWYRLRKYNIAPKKTVRKIYRAFDVYTPESCYWAGFIAADGNVFIKRGNYKFSIKLAASDYNHLLKFKDFLKTHVDVRINEKSCYIQVYSKYLVAALENNFNIIPKKSLVLAPPKYLPPDMVKHYVRGYFDGDGHIGYTGSTHHFFNITSGSTTMLEWLAEIFQGNGFIKEGSCPIYNASGKNCQRIEINSKAATDIFAWLYSESNEQIRLQRKYDYYTSTRQQIDSVLAQYKKVGRRRPPGCKGFNLDYKNISREYMSGNTLKELAGKYSISQWTLLDNFKKLGVSKNGFSKIR